MTARICGLLICLAGLVGQNARGGDLSAAQLLDSMEAVLTPETSQARVVQTIETGSGGTRDFTYVSYTGDSGKSSLIRYVSPSRVKDDAFLMLNNAADIWAYFARTRRIRKLASHARRKKLMGSDFTYEDMGGGSRYRNEYRPARLPDDRHRDTPCYVLALTPRPGQDPSYEKMVCYLRKSDYYPCRIDYYETKEELLKILYLDSITIVEGRPTARKMTMHNQQDGSKTIMVIEEITFNVALDEEFFTERNLRP